ncbi:MAG: hypothetical protein ACTSU5_10980 [Promethearchaeota archaeon]
MTRPAARRHLTPPLPGFIPPFGSQHPNGDERGGRDERGDGNEPREGGLVTEQVGQLRSREGPGDGRQAPREEVGAGLGEAGFPRRGIPPGTLVYPRFVSSLGKNSLTRRGNVYA